jgi:serine protease
MITKKPVHAIAATLLALSLWGCGGGGGSGGTSSGTSDAPPPEVPQPAPEPLPPETPAPEPEPPVITPVFSVSGTARASSSQTTDSDNNDPAHPTVPNDTASTAQAIGNPTTLGGYVNEAGSGSPGRSLESGDSDDFFRVELLAGQRITMLVADFDQADADLYLYDLQGNIVDFSVDTGEIESLTIPADATYLVNVFAFAGATNYILAIGTDNLATGQSSGRAEIVPWQTVVRYRNMEQEKQSADAREALTRRLGMEARSFGRGRARLMALRQATQREQRLGTALDKSAALQDPGLLARWETLMTIKHLRRDPQIATAEPNYRVRALATPDDEAYPFQWHYPLIGLPQAWDTTSGDPTVVVAVVDTGVLADHPDLAGQLVPGYDFISNPTSAADGDGIDPDPEDAADNRNGGVYHGTHVSGTVAAGGNNGLGVAGTAYSARIMPLRVLGAGGSGTSYDVAQALRFAAGLDNDSGTVPQRPADIINLSLGGEPFIASSQALYRELREAGVMVVAAAGNEASAAPGYPASYEGVLSVSAVDAQRRLTSYSNTGAMIDLAAPGGDNSEDLNGDGYPDGVLSTDASRDESGLRFGYSFVSGTSMAAPHVAGVLALMKSVNPALTPEDIDTLLASGELTDDLGIPGRDNNFGYGLINAQQAVRAALEATGSVPADNPRLVASANTLNFSTAVEVLELALENGGKGALELRTLETDQPWLSISPSETDADGLGTYRVQIDREELSPGTYGGYILATSSQNSLNVRILLTVDDGSDSGDIGLAYILLYDSERNEVAAQFVAESDAGDYNFEFADVPAGRYEIIAGSDADNDLIICDPGEACGAWLTLDQPIIVDVQGDLNNIDFPIEYQVSIPAPQGAAQGQRSGEDKAGVAKRPRR